MATDGIDSVDADTFGVLDGRLLGKPRDAADARRMLAEMNGREHRVITGFTILDPQSGRELSQAVETAVRFRQLREDEIAAYVATGEPLGKAGAYAIQGLGALLVEGIEGDFYNVIGLPLCALAQGLGEFGISLPF